MSNLFICPACRTVNCSGTDSCSGCGVTLSWFASQPLLSPALELQAVEPSAGLRWRLRMQVRSPQGSRTHELPLDDNMSATAELLVDRRFAFQVDRDGLALTIHQNDESWNGPLPARLQEFGLDLKCELVCDVDAAELPPRDVKQPPDDIRMTEGVLTLGRSAGSANVVLPDPTVDPVHLFLAREPGSDDCWLVDHRDSGGVWVNGKAIASCRLTGGDLIRVGPFAFVFQAREHLLVGVNEIRGAELSIDRLAVAGRLREVRSLTVPAGQFVAIAGPSGCGKSTLLKAIAGLPEVLSTGRVTLQRGENAPVDQAAQTAEFRKQLGYVSQDAFIHEELTVEEALGCVTEMQTGIVNLGEIRSWLKQLGLTSEELKLSDTGDVASGKMISQLSGGQKQRVRTAAQLIREPSILLLDEPGSGLDPDIERQLMKMLAGLARRGCTILIVLHNLDMVRYCDRVLWLDKRDGETIGHLDADMSPGDFLDWITAGRPARDEQKDSRESEPVAATDATQSKQRRYAYAASWKRQYLALIKREFQLLTGRVSLFSKLIVPVCLLPLLFAFSIAVGVNAENRDLLGFFAVLSSIWMGASVSLMSITNEREVYDHEHFLYLRITPYLCAKATAAAALSILQSTFFLLLLVIAGRLASRKLLLTNWWGFDLFFCFVLVGIVSTMLGLTISALSGRRRELAGFLLPLAMIFQIVYSVTVSMNESNTVRNVNRYFRIASTDETDGTSAANEFKSKTNRAAVWLSYLTISRWGDQMLRSFAYYQLPKDPEQRSLATWSFWGGVAWLLFDGVVLMGLSILILTLQENRRVRQIFALR